MNYSTGNILSDVLFSSSSMKLKRVMLSWVWKYFRSFWFFAYLLLAVVFLRTSPTQAQMPQRVITACSTCSPEDVHAADLDGDGDTDILSPSAGNRRIIWHENDGSADPSFTERVLAREVGDVSSVHAADVDNDGDTDVLAITELRGKVIWYENDGGRNPSFTGRTITTDFDYGESVYVADVDGDGDTDILASRGGDVIWHENDGGAGPTFTERVVATGGKKVLSVYAADVDGDSSTDVLASSGSDVAWYENDGGISPGFTQRGVATENDDVRSVYAADIDRDGHTDVLAANGDDITWYENDGSSAPSFTDQVITSEAYGAERVYATDVDGDSDVDIFSASSRLFAPTKILWYENDGSDDPAFTERIIASTTRNTTSASAVRSVYVADLDGNSAPDVLSASSRDDQVAWYENTGDSFSDQKVLADPSFAHAPLDLFASDLDGDGDTDLLSANRGDSKIAWYENDGGADPGFTGRVITADAFGAEDVHATDLDGDGDTDVLSASDGDDKIAWYENDGSPDPTFTEHEITTSADKAKSVYTADLDGDEDIDVLSAAKGDDQIAWYENNGASDPTFTEHVVTSSAEATEGVFADDVDGDGDMDILFVASAEDKIAWYENSGGDDPVFTEQIISRNVLVAEEILADDLDGDGDTDVLTADGSEVLWYENDGAADPKFTEQVITENAFRTRSIYAADLDRDGALDVLSASLGGDDVTWYESDGATDPTFTARLVATNTFRATSVYAADVNGDESPEVLSASQDDDKIAWYENTAK